MEKFQSLLDSLMKISAIINPYYYYYYYYYCLETIIKRLLFIIYYLDENLENT
jgi:hypothetical protein